MSIPYFPLYVVDFEADTAHLTIAEDGAYNRLLRLCWRSSDCALPDDDEWIRRKMRASADEYEAIVRPVLDEYFERKEGRIFNARLEEWKNRHRRESARPAIPVHIQREVWERDGRSCQYCGDSEGPFHLDHITPWRLGGSHCADNLCVACAPCNWSKGGKTLDEWGGRL